MIMEEIWKDIEGYEGRYQVSNLGRVRSLDGTYKAIRPSTGELYDHHFKGRVLKYGRSNYGHPSVVLSLNGKRESFRVRYLVANAFIKNPDNYPLVYHINGDKDDNRIDNLIWAPYNYYGEKVDTSEEWRDVKGYEGFYQVSNLGRVRSLDSYTTSGLNNSSSVIFHKGVILKTFFNSNNYKSVALSKNCKVATKMVHRLVAEAFIPNPLNLPCVNHKDENRRNSNVCNLEWCTYKYNLNYGSCQKKLQSARNLRKRPVEQLTMDGEVVGEYSSVKEAMDVTGIDVSWVLYRNGHTAGGYKWRFKE